MSDAKWVGEATKTVKVRTELIRGLFDLTPEERPRLFGNLKKSRRRLVVCDESVHASYPGIVLLLERFGVEYELLTMPGGEAAKTFANVERIMSAMDGFGVPRFGEVIGIGGGVLHDILGVATGLYRRGVDFRFFGTTLVAAIDAMFALKCAVNMGWKNRVGLYHPAIWSGTDNTAFFATLSMDDIREGFAETAKWAIGGDPELFGALEQHGPRMCAERFAGSDDITRDTIARTMRGMMKELYGNPYEERTTRRSYLGHALSTGLEPDVSHGQAVTLEILAITMVAYRRELIEVLMRDRIVNVHKAVGLKLWDPVLEDPERLLTALRDTTLHRGGHQAITTPYGRIGEVVYLHDLREDEIRRALDDLHNIAHQP